EERLPNEILKVLRNTVSGVSKSHFDCFVRLCCAHRDSLHEALGESICCICEEIHKDLEKFRWISLYEDIVQIGIGIDGDRVLSNSVTQKTHRVAKKTSD